MSREPIASLRNSWSTGSVAITAAIAIPAVVGFVWLPLHYPGERSPGSGMRSAAPGWSEEILRADYPTTRIEVVPHMLGGASAESYSQRQGCAPPDRCATVRAA